MSGEQMRVDYDRLGELQKNLDTAVRVVGSEFENMLALGVAVGDFRLAARSNQFRDSWDKRRLDIVNNLEWLRDSVKNIHEQLSGTDAALASGLTSPATGGATNSEEV
jgi:hypothetical protein